MVEDSLAGSDEPDLMDELDELERLRLLGALDDPAASRRLHALASQVEGQSHLGEIQHEGLAAEEGPRRGLAWPVAVAAVVGAAALGVAVGRWSPQGPTPAPSAGLAGGEPLASEAPPSEPSPAAQASSTPHAAPRTPPSVMASPAPHVTPPSPTAKPSVVAHQAPSTKPSAVPHHPLPKPSQAGHPLAATKPSSAAHQAPSAQAQPSGHPAPAAQALPGGQHQAPQKTRTLGHPTAQPSPAHPAASRPMPAWRPAPAQSIRPQALPSPVVRLPNAPTAPPVALAPHTAPAPRAHAPNPEHWRRPVGRAQAQGHTPAWPAARPTQDWVHVVRPGESLWAIAQAETGQGVAWTELWAENRAEVPQPRLIRPGLRLRLPGRPSAAPQAWAVVVRRGDTLSALAQRHLGSATAWPRLWRANRAQVPQPHRIFPGQALQLPWARPRQLQAAKPTPAWKPPAPRQLRRSRAAWAVVRPGETLWAIAQRSYGTGLAWRRIQALNRHRIASPESLVPGTLLRLR